MNPIKWLLKGPKHDNPVLKFLGENHTFVEVRSKLYLSHREVLFECSVCGTPKFVLQERKHK